MKEDRNTRETGASAWYNRHREQRRVQHLYALSLRNDAKHSHLHMSALSGRQRDTARAAAAPMLLLAGPTAANPQTDGRTP